MKDSFVIIKDALTNAGLDTHLVQYSFTPYSLNTDLSFKFKNLKEFVEFLNLEAPADKEKINTIKSILADVRLHADKSFYVNFYKPKVTEL
jgi:hypothetical protein